MPTADILTHKETHFVLWRPRITNPVPKLIIGQLQLANPPTLMNEQQFELTPSTKGSDLWEIAASACHLVDGQVYHYWFEVTDTNPYQNSHPRVWCTDPLAYTVDRRLLSPPIGSPAVGGDDPSAASVILYQGGKLLPCDPDGEQVDWSNDAALDTLPPNNRLVIYELPTSWARSTVEGTVQVAAGTFRDVMALIDREASPANFSGVTALEKGRAHLLDLGINTLELLPPADTFVEREWGYATSNYFAADFYLGLPRTFASPMASNDLVNLIKLCHQAGLRFFDDMVMAFATRYAYRAVNFLDFHVQANAGDPEEFVNGQKRDGFGGDLFKYNYWLTTYDPLSGTTQNLVPARRLMLTYLTHWMQYYRIDGVRMDSVNNIANWDFVGEFKNTARSLWHMRWEEQQQNQAGADERFLVVGEELSVPLDLLTQQRLDGLWNENFKRMLRYAILGQTYPLEPDFESTVRKVIDCRLAGFADGTQAINYVTSHDVEGFRNERLYNFLNNNGVTDTEPRIKLAFACLLTAVGVPMILAGEEFADQHDLAVQGDQKQLDPVNYDRMNDPWRKDIYDYVSRLVKLRTSYAALARNDTTFLHTDFTEGKRVLVWQRGQMGSDNLVVVIANFSDYGTPDPFSGVAEYVVSNWPTLPAGKRWHEATLDRNVAPEWAGREPIFPWEAKVYTLL